MATLAQTDSEYGYIVSMAYDTTYGSVKMESNQEVCHFKAAGSNNFERYLPVQLISIRDKNGKYYVSKEVTDQNNVSHWYFLEYLVDGELDLYVILGTDQYFISKSDGTIIELQDKIKHQYKNGGKVYTSRDKKYIGYLRSSMADAPQLFPEIDNIDFLNQQQLVDVCINYHNAVCDSYQCIDYAKNLHKPINSLEIQCGLTRHSSYYMPAAAVLVHLGRYKNPNLYVKTGVLFSDNPYWVDPSVEKNYSLKFGGGIEYIFKTETFRPFVALMYFVGMDWHYSSAQVGFTVEVDEDVNFIASVSMDGLHLMLYQLHPVVYNNNFGHTINIGLSYLLKPKK